MCVFLCVRADAGERLQQGSSDAVENESLCNSPSRSCRSHERQLLLAPRGLAGGSYGGINPHSSSAHSSLYLAVTRYTNGMSVRALSLRKRCSDGRTRSPKQAVSSGGASNHRPCSGVGRLTSAAPNGHVSSRQFDVAADPTKAGGASRRCFWMSLNKVLPLPRLAGIIHRGCLASRCMLPPHLAPCHPVCVA